MKKIILSTLVLFNVFVWSFVLMSCVSNSVLMVQRTKGPLPGISQFTLNKVNKYDSIIRLVSPDGYFYCTGFVVDNNYAITAAHCVLNDMGIMNTDDVLIHNSHSFFTGVIAKPVAVEKYRDVAFLKGDFSEFSQQATDFNGKSIKTGMKLKSCGYPSGQYDMFCVDLIQNGNRYFQYRATGAPIFKGMSGGPVYNEEGVAVGVNSAVDEDTIIISPLTGVLETVGL